ncbi:S8 family serine peptidase [Amycolatopsis magusensis]|uniref:S8 family serine peptidase n=1 Tax=Amycolatopsis magusensis TaxID=882444 RepID=UPI0037A08556
MRTAATILGLITATVLAATAPASAAAGGTQLDPPTGLDRIDQRDFGRSGTYSWRTTGSEVHAYVLGDLIATTHTTFGGRAANGPDFTGAPACQPMDNPGTGLASVVGGTRHGVAKEVRITGVRVTACSHTTTSERLIQGLDWVSANAVRPAVAVLNISHGADPAVDEAALRLIRSGVTLVTTSGIEDHITGDRDPVRISPGRVPEAITVASGSLINFFGSRQGPGIDLYAPFSDMAIGGGSDEYNLATNEAGVAAGAAVLVLSEHPTWTPAQVQRALVDHATPGAVNPPPLNGAPNRMLYVGP